MTEAEGHPGKLRTLVLLHIVRILQDGKWHNREKVIEQCMGVVSDGVAKRQREKNRAHHFKKGEEVKPRKHTRKGDPIASGARSIIQTALRQDVIEIDRSNPDKKKQRVRLLKLPRPARSYPLPPPIDHSEQED